MIILALEASAKSAGAAIIQDNTLLAETYLNNGLTHSQTLLPLVDACLKTAQIPLNRVDAMAVSIGPGSFTGIRIGVSAVKGLCFANQIPVYGISTLEAMACGATLEGYIISPVMDARCQQVYNAMFTYENGVVNRLTEDSPLKLEELKELISRYDRKILLLGDGADLTHKYMEENGIKTERFPEIFRFQHASGVAFAALMRYNNGEKPMNARELTPCYLRLSQAERERKNKGANQS